MDVIKESYKGVFTRFGYWIDGNDKEIEISEMGAKHKKNVIKHLLKAVDHIEHSKTKSDMNGHRKVEFSGKYAEDLAKKLEEFGCTVKENNGTFSININ